MSEFQYYEFLSIDKPLTSEEMAELRAVSTRARITPTGFVNEYHWGDLKANPLEWMKRYFDAHVYLANWGQSVLYLRVPLEIFDARTLDAFVTESSLDIHRAFRCWIIEWSLQESEDYERFGMEDGSGWMGRLVPLREELLRGDTRALYLGWLAGVSCGEVSADATEPPPPPGLSRLTAAQQALVAFLEIDPDLVTAAGAGDRQDSEDTARREQQIETWLADWSPEAMRATLGQLLDGRSRQAERELMAQFTAWQREQSGDADSAIQRRRVADLQALAASARQAREQREAEERARREAERRKQREARLRILAQNFPEQWRKADELAERGIASAYDEANRLLVDLADAYRLCASEADFERAMQGFMASHARRAALVRRLVKAGLWRKE